MFEKLLALVPLLGWFYLVLFAYGVMYYLLPKKRKVLMFLFYGFFGCYATIMMIENLKQERTLFAESKISLYQSYEEKISSEAGSGYDAYFRVFRSYTVNSPVVYLVGIDTKEYHYARMFLYPSSVMLTENISQKKPGWYVIKGDPPLKIKAEVHARSAGRSLLFIRSTP